MFAAVAMAATSSTLKVSATITPGCKLSGGSAPLDFGTLDFGARPAVGGDRVQTSLTPQSGLKLMCTPGVSLLMSVNGGLHSQGGQRHLHNGKRLLPYQLYADAGLNRPIAINQAVALRYDHAEDLHLPLHGVLQLPGVTPAGIYQDVLIVTLSW